MLSGEEEKWQQLKVALPRLEGLKTESSILSLHFPAETLDSQ